MSREIRISCNRLYMRTPARGDFEAWRDLRIANKSRLQPWEPLWSEDANTRGDWRLRMRAWRKNWRAGRGYAFLLFSTDSDRLLGGAAITNVRRGAAQSGILGYWLGMEATGNGLMTEAVTGLCKWARAELRLSRIEASTLPENVASQRVLERCGFKLEGKAQSYLEIAGKRRDHVLYGLDISA